MHMLSCSCSELLSLPSSAHCAADGYSSSLRRRGSSSLQRVLLFAQVLYVVECSSRASLTLLHQLCGLLLHCVEEALDHRGTCVCQSVRRSFGVMSLFCTHHTKGTPGNTSMTSGTRLNRQSKQFESLVFLLSSEPTPTREEAFVLCYSSMPVCARNGAPSCAASSTCLLVVDSAVLCVVLLWASPRTPSWSICRERLHRKRRSVPCVGLCSAWRPANVHRGSSRPENLSDQAAGSLRCCLHALASASGCASRRDMRGPSVLSLPCSPGALWSVHLSNSRRARCAVVLFNGAGGSSPAFFRQTKRNVVVTRLTTLPIRHCVLNRAVRPPFEVA